MSNKHFKLTEDSITIRHDDREVQLFRIEATRDFAEVKMGQLGGYVERLDNLRDEAWVSGEAWVFGGARVYGNARISGKVKIYGNALITDNAQISDNVRIFGNSKVYGNTRISGNVWVSGNAVINGNSQISGNVHMFGNAKVYGNAIITSKADFCVFQGFGSAGRTTTFYKTQGSGVEVVCGCFTGNLEAFADRVVKTHGDNKFAREYLAMIDMVKIKMGLE